MMEIVFITLILIALIGISTQAVRRLVITYKRKKQDNLRKAKGSRKKKYIISNNTKPK